MKVDGGIGALGAGGDGIASIAAAAKGQEQLGYDGIWSAAHINPVTWIDGITYVTASKASAFNNHSNNSRMLVSNQ